MKRIFVLLLFVCLLAPLARGQENPPPCPAGQTCGTIPFPGKEGSAPDDDSLFEDILDFFLGEAD